MKATVLESIDEVDPAAWDALAGAGAPLVSHAFLAAMEHQGCVGPDAGWKPRHIVVRDPDAKLVAAMPLYEKTNSWGEFVFDFSWAQAFHRVGLPYYPKLVSAVPFTPATGPRLLTLPGHPEASALLLDTAVELARAEGLSSLHVLFGDEHAREAARVRGLHPRLDCQFHWTNRGYEDFDAFLATFRSSRRKKLRRERRRVAEAGITFRWLSGAELDDGLLDRIYPFYERTFLLRGNAPYLNRGFFEEIRETLPAQLLVILAEAAGRPVAAAICLRGQDRLYGRYWGAEADYHSLHFETCFYQGIEYCVTHGLAAFEPGAQGEHKLRRGFEPVPTWSAHWIANRDFDRAISSYLERERIAVTAYIEDADGQLPFRQTDPSSP